MSAGYVPQVGDRVRLTSWRSGIWMDVKALVEGRIGGPDEADDWEWWLIERTDAQVWVKVDKPEPWPERWVVRTMGGDQVEKATLDLAIRCAKGYDFLPSDRIRIDHYLSDGSVTVLDHTGAET